MMTRIGWPVVLAASIALSGCAANDQADEPATGAGEHGVATASSATPSPTASLPETGLAESLPDGFPADVPVHPGTVTAYEAIQVTDAATVHQLTVETAASFDEVLSWYQNHLPAGWSVGFQEVEGLTGAREGKIALTGGTYAPADPGGMGGGVIIGLFEAVTTEIVTTVTVMVPR